MPEAPEIGVTHTGVSASSAKLGRGDRACGPRRLFRGRVLFLLPAVIYLLALFAYPIVYGILLSIRQSSVITFVHNTGGFVGLTNYRLAVTNPLLPGVVWNTAIFMVGSIVMQFSIGFLIALFFTRRFPLSGFLRSLILVPWLLPGVVTGIILRMMFDPNIGMVNQVLSTPRAHPFTDRVVRQYASALVGHRAREHLGRDPIQHVAPARRAPRHPP